MSLKIIKHLFLAVILVCSTELLAESKEKLEDEVDTTKNRNLHFGIGVAKPKSIGSDNNHYEKLFGSGSTYPEFWGDVSLLPLFWGFDLGLTFRVGLYRDSGKGAKDVDPASVGDLADANVDSSQKSVLTLIPIQSAINLSYSPLANRYVVINAWAGYSYTFVENTTQARLDNTINQSEIKPFVNSGFNQESINGFSLSIDISMFDPRAAYSLKVYGISGIFLTPFMQNVKTMKNKVGTYDRTVYGLMFSFETLGS